MLQLQENNADIAVDERQFEDLLDANLFRDVCEEYIAELKQQTHDYNETRLRSLLEAAFAHVSHCIPPAQPNYDDVDTTMQF